MTPRNIKTLNQQLNEYRGKHIGSEMLISGTDGMELPAGFGIIVLVSSLVNTDSYCLLSMAALSFGSACILPFSFSGDTPLVSLLGDFEYSNYC
jgi:hypothetical protein